MLITGLDLSFPHYFYLGTSKFYPGTSKFYPGTSKFYVGTGPGMSGCSYNTGEQYMDVCTELLQRIPTVACLPARNDLVNEVKFLGLITQKR